MRKRLLLAAAMLILASADARADAFCFKCTTDYRCTSVITNASMQCMSTRYGCRSWDPCSTGSGCTKEHPDCVEEPTPSAADEKPWRLVAVSILPPATRHAALLPASRP